MKHTRLVLGLALAGLSFSASATNGYFAHGYGMKAKGMAGAATASFDNAFGGANNPASVVFAGNRMELGLDLFSPRREISRSGSSGWAPNSRFVGDPGAPPLNESAESDSNYFFIPEFGYSRTINSNLAVGLTVYGNGGMNTDFPSRVNACSGNYGGASSNTLCGRGSLGVDLMQLIVAPTAAYKVSPNHAFGISPLLGYQLFKAEGLDAFGQISTNNSKLTNKGYDSAFGYGVRVGYMGQLSPTVTIGAAYASKMRFEEFDDYAGLFAEKGDFDIPENYNLGIAWQATPQMKFALDYQRINYGGVKSVSNPSTNFTNCPGAGCLGNPAGAGFGWADIDVWKLGVEYKYNNRWTSRAGWNHGDNPISPRDVEFNMIAPGVIKDHLTLGLTYTTATGGELTVAYMHGFENDVSGPSWFFDSGSATGNKADNIKMYQNSIGIQYAWKM